MTVNFQMNLNQSALGFNGKVFFPRMLGVVQIASENPQSIAGFLRFTPVRIVYAQSEVGFFRRPERQNAVTSHSPMPIAESPDGPRC